MSDSRTASVLLSLNFSTVCLKLACLGIISHSLFSSCRSNQVGQIGGLLSSFKDLDFSEMILGRNDSQIDSSTSIPQLGQVGVVLK